MIQVRKLQPKDLQELDINAQALGFQQDVMHNKLDEMLVAINNSKICGIGVGTLVDNQCLLNWIHIMEQYRRDRLGTLLIKSILNIYEQKGALRAYAFTECKEFAESLGFMEVKDQDEIQRIHALYSNSFASTQSGKLFQVSLIDYFKPCCSK